MTDAWSRMGGLKVVKSDFLRFLSPFCDVLQ